MITNYFKFVALLILLLFINICSVSAISVAVPPGISINVTPGYIDEDKKVTEEKIQILHEYMNNEQYKTIVEDASEIMKNALGKDVLLNAIKNFHQELGKFIKVEDKKMNVIVGSPIQIRAVYVSTFEKGRITELFNFIKENDRDIKLASYQIIKDPSDLGHLDNISWVNQGKADLQCSRYEKAVQDFSKAIELYPKAESYVYRAVAYYAMHDYDKALIDCCKAIELNPNYELAYYNRGLIYRQKGEFDKAISDYTQAIKIKPDYAEAYLNRGVAFLCKEDIDKAIDNYSKVIELRPGWAVAYVNRGNMYNGKKDYDKAIADYDRAIELDPNYALVYYFKAAALEEQQAYNAAIKAYEEFIKRADVSLAQRIEDAKRHIQLMKK